MRRLLLMSILMLAGQILQAVPITKEQAKEAAAKFLKQKKGTSQARSRDMRPVSLTETEGVASDAFYIFNVGKAEGFVIVSNDDCTDEILGYADKGEIVPEDMPENMKAWLQGYADEIKWMREHHISGKSTASARKKAAVKTVILPLLQTTWNQGEPYYNNCPVYSGTRCVTGCVATAMAQVVNYHGQISHKPEKTQAVAEYDCYTNRGTDANPIHIHVNAIAADQPLNWNNMINDYAGSATDAQKAAVALLMQYCGSSVQMDYGPKSSGAFVFDVSYALKKYFGYDADTRYVRREDYTIMDWDNLIYGELASGRPVVYGGQSSGGGHAFVIDGYDDDGFFHVNWGWGGHNDGLFRLSALNPYDNSGIGASSTRDGYNYDQDAVIGAQPSTGQAAAEEEIPFLLGTIIEVSDEHNTIKASFTNCSGETNSFNYGIGYLDGENFVPVIQETWYDLGDGYFIDPIFTISGLADGSYKLYTISKLTTSNIWRTSNNLERDYVLAEVINGNITLTKNAPAPDLAVSVMTFSGLRYVNNTQNVEITLSNSGEEFTGDVYLFASSDPNNKGQHIKKVGIAVRKNRSIMVDMSFLPTVAGDYKVWVCFDKEGTKVIGSGSITIANVNNVNTSDFQIVGCSFGNEDPSTLTIDDGGAPNQIIDVYAKDIIAQITIKNMASESKSYYFTFLLSEYNGSDYESVTFNSGTYYGLSMSSGATHTYQVDLGQLNLGGLAFGKRYKIILQKLEVNNNNTITGQSLFDDHIRFQTVSAYPVWDANGTKSIVKTSASELTISDDVAAVDLSGYTFTNVTANSNPNTLYYLSESQDIPTGLSGKNVIKGTTASEIHLQDDKTYSFYVPKEFTATNITYTRQFSTAASTETGGWNTMVIPFDVETVKVGDKTLSWFQNDDDSDKDFWLLQFTSDETDQVNFSYTDKIRADYPYLIAVPGDTWGEAHKLTGKDIVFGATNATITTTDRAMLSGDFYTMYGTYAPRSVASGAYVLNSTGSGFVKKSGTVTLRPFRAYIMPKYGYSSHSGLKIGMTGNQATGIIPRFSTSSTTSNDVYSISGIKVGTVDNMQHLKPGIYIVNGKKIIKH